MRDVPMFYPMVVGDYMGYSLHCTAHRQSDETFKPSLEIRDYRYRAGELVVEYTFRTKFSDPDAAIDKAMLIGRQAVYGLMSLMNCDEVLNNASYRQ